MQLITPILSRKEHVLFDLHCCMSELCELKQALTVDELDAIAQDLKTLVRLSEFIVTNGEVGAALLVDYTIEEAEACLSNHYHGAYDNEVDFAYEFFDQCYGYAIPNNLSYYVDYAAFARDLFNGKYFSVEVNGKVHVFSHY